MTLRYTIHQTITPSPGWPPCCRPPGPCPGGLAGAWHGPAPADPARSPSASPDPSLSAARGGASGRAGELVSTSTHMGGGGLRRAGARRGGAAACRGGGGASSLAHPPLLGRCLVGADPEVVGEATGHGPRCQVPAAAEAQAVQQERLDAHACRAMGVPTSQRPLLRPREQRWCRAMPRGGPRLPARELRGGGGAMKRRNRSRNGRLQTAALSTRG